MDSDERTARVAALEAQLGDRVVWTELHRGHLLVALEGDQSPGWGPLVLRYAEDLSLAHLAGERPCGLCGLVADEWLGPDPCLGLINGVAAACCGHGDTNEAYVVLRNDKAYYGERALAMLA